MLNNISLMSYGILMMMPYGRRTEALAPAVEKMERRSEKLARKESRQARKNLRLLERLMTESPNKEKKDQKKSWVPPRVIFYEREKRPYDPKELAGTRRVPGNFPRIRGWRTTDADNEPAWKNMRRRVMLGNCDGIKRGSLSIRSIEIRKPTKRMLDLDTWPRIIRERTQPIRQNMKVTRRLAKELIQEELASIAEQERADLAELAKLDEEMRREIQEWLDQENQRQEKVRHDIEEAEELDRANESELEMLRESHEYAGNHDSWD